MPGVPENDENRAGTRGPRGVQVMRVGQRRERDDRPCGNGVRRVVTAARDLSANHGRLVSAERLDHGGQGVASGGFRCWADMPLVGADREQDVTGPGLACQLGGAEGRAVAARAR